MFKAVTFLVILSSLLILKSHHHNFQEGIDLKSHHHNFKEDIDFKGIDFKVEVFQDMVIIRADENMEVLQLGNTIIIMPSPQFTNYK